MKSKIINPFLVVLTFSFFLISGCIDDRTETGAPGCDGGGWVPTGCLGKSLIKNITVEPAVACLKVDANNCNGGILGIENKCDVDFKIGGQTIYAHSYQTVEFVRNAEGEIFVIEPHGNFDSYNPEDEDFLSFKGTLGEEEITISYLKKNVCGTAKTPDIGGVSLEMFKTNFDPSEPVEAFVEADKMFFTGFPAFEVYQLIDEEWHYVDIYDFFCALPCSANISEICGGPIACAPLPLHCMDFDFLSDNFEWDQTILKIRTIECPDSNETAICSFEEKAEPGTYKFVFQYSTNCINTEFFYAEENNVQTIEKTFEITPSAE
ncbi:hypothetical protein KAW38_01015 [Candidatus Micrarchaeota archaeon]|nr:hypothetical protein [Candidatus Micrarchaeota archaeon]